MQGSKNARNVRCCMLSVQYKLPTYAELNFPTSWIVAGHYDILSRNEVSGKPGAVHSLVDHRLNTS